MPADVAVGDRSQDGIGDGVEKNVGVRVPGQTNGMGNGHAAQPERTSGHERMNVETEADPQVRGNQEKWTLTETTRPPPRRLAWPGGALPRTQGLPVW